MVTNRKLYKYVLFTYMMSKDLNTIIKETLKTLSGVESYQLFKDNVKDMKERLGTQDQYRNNSAYKKAKKNMHLDMLIEGIRLGIHALAKSTLVATTGAYVYEFITGDTGSVHALVSSPVLFATAAYVDFRATADTKKYIRQKKVKEERKRTNEEFKKRMEEREEDFKKQRASFYKNQERTFNDAFNSEEFKNFFEEFKKAAEGYAGSRNTGGYRNTSRISSNSIESLYQTLGVKYPSPIADVKKAYRTIAKQTHPDFNNGDQSRVAEFQKATDAYNKIEEYDTYLKSVKSQKTN
jgi:hypothetical protein